MGVYYYTILFMAFFAFSAQLKSYRDAKAPLFKRECSWQSKFLLTFATSTLIVVAGCRYGVGTDYSAYYNGMQVYADRFFDKLRAFDEPALSFIAVIVSSFTEDGAYFIFVCSFLTLSLYMLQIYGYESSYLMSSLLFVFAGIWAGTFNGVRQYLASAILFTGHRYIYEKKFWKYLIVVLLASSVHISAVIMIVPFFLLRNKINLKNVVLLAAGTALVSANYDAVFSFIGFLKDSDFTELNSYASTTVNILRILVAAAPAIVCLVIYWKKNLTREQTFYINALIVHGAAMIAASNSAYLARIGIFTSPFLPVAIPKLVRFENKATESLIRIGIIVMYFAYWYIGISGSSTLSNYRWIFQR